MTPPLDFGCCFCGNGGADKGLELVNKDSGEFDQQWWCHLDCLLKAMNEQFRDSYVKPERHESEPHEPWDFSGEDSRDEHDPTL